MNLIVYTILQKKLFVWTIYLKKRIFIEHILEFYTSIILLISNRKE